MGIDRRTVLSGIVGLGLTAALPVQGAEATRLSGHAFGTKWSVLLPRGMDGAEAGAIAAILSRIEGTMSPFRPESTLSRFNRSSAGQMAVEPELAFVTAEALRIAAWSGGAFDPTVGPLVGRYGFGPITGERQGDYSALSCEAGGIAKSVAHLTLDLCGIAKGYALDAVGDALSALGHGDFLIDIGGELLAAGTGPGGAPWRLGIEDPLGGGVRTRLETEQLALATSGDTVHFYEVGGRRYSHTIDPRTGAPVLNPVASVSVAHASAMTADAMATAMMVLGPDAGLDLAEAADLPVLFLLRGEDGGLVDRQSPALSRLRPI